MIIRNLLKQLFRTASILIAVALGLLVTYIGCKLAYAAVDKEDCFYVRDAQLLDPAYLHTFAALNDKLEDFHFHFGFSAHRLKPGYGTILGYRFFSSGNVMAIDDEIYRKITIWLPDDIKKDGNSDTALGTDSKIVALFSSGSSAWPDGDCSGYVSSGRLHTETRGNRIFVSLHGLVFPKAWNSLRQCDQITVDIKFEAKPLVYSKLTPWLGSVGGDHPYDETYRR